MGPEMFVMVLCCVAAAGAFAVGVLVGVMLQVQEKKGEWHNWEGFTWMDCQQCGGGWVHWRRCAGGGGGGGGGGGWSSEWTHVPDTAL